MCLQLLCCVLTSNVCILTADRGWILADLLGPGPGPKCLGPFFTIMCTVRCLLYDMAVARKEKGLVC